MPTPDPALPSIPRLPTVKTGSVIGRDHQRLLRNNQDSVATRSIKINGTTYHFGVVCDGCSGQDGVATNNEVGAQLMSCFIIKEITTLLLMELPIDYIVGSLYNRCLGYLHALGSLSTSGNLQESTQFISKYLCCTIIGFVMDEKSAVIFSAGDGVIAIDNGISRINQDNHPFYLGLSIVDPRFLKMDVADLPKSFITHQIDLNQIHRFALCTDGITETAIPKIFGLTGGHSGPLGLGRKLKVLSLREEPFADDCTVITIEFDEVKPADVSIDQTSATPAVENMEQTDQ